MELGQQQTVETTQHIPAVSNIDKSSDSIPTDELTDMASCSDEQPTQREPGITAPQTIKQPQKKEEDLQTMVEQQRELIERLQQENQQQKHKIEELTSRLHQQGSGTKDNKQRLQQRFENITQKEAGDYYYTNFKPMAAKLNKIKSSQADPQRTTDFWKERDQSFYKSKNQFMLKSSALKLEDIKQDLWIKQEREALLSQSMKAAPNNSTSTINQSQNIDIKKKHKNINKNTLKNSARKVLNEDLGESQDFEAATDSVPSQVNSSRFKSQVTDRLSVKNSVNRLEPLKLNKLEALKFKMSLQTKNLKLLKEHDLLIRDIEKKQTGGRRDNKLHTIQTINRLHRDLERSQKQLKTELSFVLGSGDPIAESKVVKQCQELYDEVQHYFVIKEIESKKIRAKKDYSCVRSRVNTNITGITHSKPINCQDLLNEQSECDTVNGDVGSSSSKFISNYQSVQLPQINKRR